jgi:glyoxylase-like metal-dependent hydrolase (beta-lactamase superfamily II)
MTRKLWFALAVMVLFPGIASAQDAKSVLQSATKAMGDVKSIQYSGTGHLDQLGQAFTPGAAWPETIVTSYTKTIDYASRSAKEELTRVEPNPPVKGGGRPFAGEDKQVNLVSGQYAWDQPGSSPVPQVAAAGERQLQIWLTPHGFLKAAAENNAAAKKGATGTVVSFTTGKFKVDGTLDTQNLVAKTETWLPNPVLGDMLVETTFSNYEDYNGVKFPTMIVQKQGGHPVFDLKVTAVKANTGLSLSVPDAVKTATIPAVKVTSQKIADGTWFLAGGSHNSILVEYPNYLVMIEAPLTEARSLAVIDEAKKLVPNKPIKYLINTHNHFDHSGGVRTYVAEGATVITNEINVPFYEKAWTAPHKLDPDMLSKDPKKPDFIPVKEKYALDDGGRSLEIYHIDGDTHNAGLMMVYLPKEKILVEADDFTPNTPTVPAPSGPRPRIFCSNLVKQLQRLKLDPTTVAPLHGIVVPFSDLKKEAGVA